MGTAGSSSSRHQPALACLTRMTTAYLSVNRSLCGAHTQHITAHTATPGWWIDFGQGVQCWTHPADSRGSRETSWDPHHICHGPGLLFLSLICAPVCSICVLLGQDIPISMRRVLSIPPVMTRFGSATCSGIRCPGLLIDQ